MDKRAGKFLDKKNIHHNQILYLNRSDGKTRIFLNNGRCHTTYLPLKCIMSALPDEKFLSINKGIYVSASQIVDISNGIYTMSDGKTFRGRVRTTGIHKKNQFLYAANPSSSPQKNSSAEQLKQQFSILDDMPVAFCIIELIFDKKHQGIDFIFRYCNHEMEQLENMAMEDMLDHSFYDVFKNGDPKWLISYADVALNGGQKIIRDYSPEIDSNLTIYCFQPKENFCACALIKS